MTIREIMTHDVETASPQETVLDARDRFQRGGFRHLPIVDGRVLVGMVSDRDVLRAAGPSLARLSIEEDEGPNLDRTLAEIMTPVPITADPMMSVQVAADMLLRHDMSALPIIDEGYLVGIVTTADILRLAASAPVGV